MMDARSKRARSAGVSALRLLCVAVGLAACTGNVLGEAPHGSGQQPGSGTTSGGTSGVAQPGGSTFTTSLVCKAGAVDPGPSPMKLLTRSQYLNSMRDLVGEVPNLSSALGASSNASAFGLVQPDVAQVDLENYRTAATLVAKVVVGSTTLLQKLAPCTSSAVKRDCVKSFVQNFGARVYRAPVTDPADIERHLALYDVGAKVSHEHGIELLLQGVLQAPRFLYRVEVGTSDHVSNSAVKLSPYEVAARLSYALWDTLPDDKLTQAALSGQLSTKQGVSAQLSWMLADPKGQKLVRRFLENWIHLPDLNGSVKDSALFPAWSATTLRASMQDQARSFFDEILTHQGGKLSALLTSPTVFLNKDLGSYYGMSGGDAFAPVERADGATSGLLTLPALLTLLAKPAESSPIYRGKFVREALFCQQLPAPPANVPKPPEVTPGVSTRERLKEHETNTACKSCHLLMDPIGFGFENYDAVGHYRTQDGSGAVDARGEISGTDEIDGKFNGVAELGQKLSQSELVRECVTRQWFRFALSRFEQDVDNCSMRGIVDHFEAAGADLNTLPAAVVESDAFLYRHPVDSEIAP